MEYWHKDFKCPFYEGNGKRQLICQVGTLSLPDKMSILEFMNNCLDKYNDCPIYVTLLNFEERREEEKKNAKRRK